MQPRKRMEEREELPGVPEGKPMLAGEAHLMGSRRVTGGDLFAFVLSGASGWRGLFNKLTNEGLHVLLYHLPTNTWTYGGEYSGTQNIPEPTVRSGYVFHYFKPCQTEERPLGNEVLRLAHDKGLLKRYSGNSGANFARSTLEANRIVDAYRQGRAEQAAKIPHKRLTEEQAKASSKPDKLDFSRVLPPSVVAAEFLQELERYHPQLHVHDGKLLVKKPESLTLEELEQLRTLFRKQARRFHPDSNQGVQDLEPYNLVAGQIGGILNQLGTEIRKKVAQEKRE